MTSGERKGEEKYEGREKKGEEMIWEGAGSVMGRESNGGLKKENGREKEKDKK